MKRSTHTIARLFCLLATSSLAHAQLAVTRELVLVPGDVASGDAYGSSLDGYGERVVVGSPLHDTGGVGDAGAAYVFRRSQSGWIEEAKLVASDPGLGDEFGRAVAIHGDTAVVGAWKDDTGQGVESGSLYVFVRSGTTWAQQAKLVPSGLGPGDSIGLAVALEGNTILAGAPGDDLAGQDAGAVHAFVRTGTSWSRTQELRSPTPTPSAGFGSSVALDGDLAGVGEPVAGRLIGFERVGSVWSSGSVLAAFSTVTGFRLGASVDLVGGTLAVGAPVGAPFGASASADAGRVAVLQRTGSAWSTPRLLLSPFGTEDDQLGADVCIGPEGIFTGSPGETSSERGLVYGYDQEPLPLNTGYGFLVRAASQDAAGGDEFGASLAWVGEELIVGGPGANDGTGTVRALLFREPFPTIAQTQRLDLTGNGHDLGRSVSLSGDTLVAGAPEITSAGAGGPGSVRVFERGPSGQWGAPAVIAPGGLLPGDNFGESVAVDGDRFVATGADNAGLGAGAAYVYRREAPGWVLEAKLTAPDLAQGDMAGPVALSGTTLAVGAYGDDGPTGTWHGSVNVWVRSGTSWSHQARIQPQSTGTALFFGQALALDGDTLLVGTERSPAFVYRRTGTVWTEEAQLLGSPDPFGRSVDLDGDRAVVSSSGIAAAGPYTTGAVWVYERTGTQWTSSARLIDPRPRNTAFGSRVALDGNRLLAGGLFPVESGLLREDATLFQRQASGEWTPVRTLITEPVHSYALGTSLDLVGDTAVLGAPDDALAPLAPGTVYVYDLNATFQAFCDGSDGALSACPCANPGTDDSGCAPAQGDGVKLEVFGQQFGLENRATLTGSGFPPTSTPTTVALRGASLEPSPLAFGDGLRCLALPLVRVRAAFAIGGTTTYAIGHDAPAGSFYYQLLFRSGPVSFCDGTAAFNLSNGRVLTW